MLTDYHLHTNHSFDGTQTMDELCCAAMAQSIDEIAVTDHMDIYRGRSYDYILDCPAAFADYEHAREACAGRLRIRYGIELGQPMRNPAAAEAFLRDWPVDFVIGSLHHMHHDIDIQKYDFNKLDFREFFPFYLDALYDLAANYDYDVLGHVTYPMRYYQAYFGKTLSSMEWKSDFAEIFRAVIGRGKGIELNLSVYTRGYGILMPDMDLLRLYRSLGGEIITMGSDAHVKEHTGRAARQGIALLKEAGFRCLTTYDGRKAIMNPLD